MEGRGDEYDDDDDGSDYGVRVVAAEVAALGSATPLVAISALAKSYDAAIAAIAVVFKLLSRLLILLQSTAKNATTL